MEDILFTTENLLDNLDQLGAWSSFGLAEEAIKYYYPDEFHEENGCPSGRVAELLHEMGFRFWHEVIQKYHTEVGYKPLNGVFNTDAVNKF
jgi:hypothetical protein